MCAFAGFAAAMSPGSLTDGTRGTALGVRRSEVLDCLREADGPATVAAVAERTGLHVNTARFHLDALVRQGRAERRTEGRDSPGRPRVLYTAAPDGTGPRSYRLLARMLTSLVASLDHDGSGAADAGRAWGRHLVERGAPMERLDEDAALQRLHTLLAEVGFEPETRADSAEVRIHHCPFLEVAQDHPEVVCALHRGLMEGALDELDAPVGVEDLEPFVTPRLCVARLRNVGR